MRGDWLSDPMGGIPGDLAEQEGIGPSPILRAPELRPRAPKDFLLAPVAAVQLRLKLPLGLVPSLARDLHMNQ